MLGNISKPPWVRVTPEVVWSVVRLNNCRPKCCRAIDHVDSDVMAVYSSDFVRAILSILFSLY
ncbi:hypothetical protein BU23DRAFT_493978 [Bimuria novae-zelandiae CBS 107.79]|uniref:Uncharacterized protein n=1 Tax=Bimuria novae-zelandiae CBS 107.79 TaxID=1447943 RepID=A0A6A5UFV7_9PLEO|nr:hypothetical protein BU23DRAFT_493978 [Bimuria novae-zelandiae CBS 107.79]